MKIKYILLAFVVLFTIKSFSQDSARIIHENVVEPKFKDSLKFEDLIRKKFNSVINRLSYFVIGVEINKYGSPQKINFSLDEDGNSPTTDDLKEIRLFIISKCKWKPGYKLKSNKKILIDFNKWYSIKTRD